MTEIFDRIEKDLLGKGFKFERKDINRPWGAFWVIQESQALMFAQQYFPEISPEALLNKGRVSPKILLVAPHKRLSWQYHHRRSEIWKVIEGTVGVKQSDSDEEQDMKTCSVNDIIILKKGERHRLVGLDDWGVIAEIWQHTDPNHLSDENDIVRLQDDFKRT